MKKMQLRVLASTPYPQTLVRRAMQQCRSCDPVLPIGLSIVDDEDYEAKSGHVVVKHLLSGGRGHFGCFEHPSITLVCENWPHSVMQQLRTHRVGVSFDVQSFRQSQDKLLDAAVYISRKVLGWQDLLEDLVYIQPIQTGYDYAARSFDIHCAALAIEYYAAKVAAGMKPDAARSALPFDYFQSWVMSLNARSLMHMLDLRYKKDAQNEAQEFARQLFITFKLWMPEVAIWYEEKRLGTARLSP